MSTEIRWSIEGEQQLVRRIKELDSRLTNFKPVFGKVVSELKSIFSNDVFQTQGGVIGESWKPLKPEYLAAKRKRGYSGGTLVASGRMQKSFKTMFDANRGEVWNSVEYFQYHQSNQPRKVLPRRVMMKLDENQKQMIVKAFHEALFK